MCMERILKLTVVFALMAAVVTHAEEGVVSLEGGVSVVASVHRSYPAESDDDSGWNYAYAEISGADAEIEVTHLENAIKFETNIYRGYLNPASGHCMTVDQEPSDIEYSDSLLTVGTSAAYPAGTPLTMIISVNNYEDWWASGDLMYFVLYHADEGTPSFVISDVSPGYTAFFEAPVIAGDEYMSAFYSDYTSTEVTMWVVPEPTGMLLLLPGGLLLLRRR